MGISLQPEDIESIKVIGQLNGKEVKLIRTFGGFHIAVGKKSKYSKDTEALGAGSHPGLVSFKIGQDFEDFEPIMCKSEDGIREEVINYTSSIPTNLIQDGIEMFCLAKGDFLDFIVTKYGVDIRKIETSVDHKELALNINKGESNPEFLNVPYNDIMHTHIILMWHEEMIKRGLVKVVNNDDE